VKKLCELIPDDESFERIADKVQAIVSHRKPANVANDNAKLSPGWAATINKLEANNGTVPKKERFQITWFDDVDQSAAKEEIVQGVLGAGEFSLFVAKPGTAKSVLVGDIGCHIAAGIDWHGRKVKQGLVVFYAAERKRLTERRVAAWAKKHRVTKIPFVVVGGKLDLTTGLVDAKVLAMTIKALEEKSGHKCVLINLCRDNGVDPNQVMLLGDDGIFVVTSHVVPLSMENRATQWADKARQSRALWLTGTAIRSDPSFSSASMTLETAREIYGVKTANDNRVCSGLPWKLWPPHYLATKSENGSPLLADSPEDLLIERLSRKLIEATKAEMGPAKVLALDSFLSSESFAVLGGKTGDEGKHERS
jgi:hypothetical protein